MRMSRGILRSGVLLPVMLGGCDWWPLPPPNYMTGETVDTDATGSSVSTGDAPTGTGMGSSPPTSDGTATTTGSEESTASSGPGATGSDSTTDGCPVAWENCEPLDGIDDNCDEINVCEGTLKPAGEVYGPTIFDQHVVPVEGGPLGSFFATIHFIGDIGVPPLPNTAKKSLVIVRYVAGTGTLTIEDSDPDVDALAFDHAAGRSFMVTRTALGVHRLFEFAGGTLTHVPVALEDFDRVDAIAVTEEQVVIVGECAAETCVGSVALASETLTVRTLVDQANLLVRDVLVFEGMDRLVVLGFVGATATIVRAALPTDPLDLDPIWTSSQMFAGNLQLSHLAWDNTPGLFHAAGKAVGNVVGFGAASTVVGDVMCGVSSADMVVGRFNVIAAGEPDRSVRSDCADAARSLAVEGLAVEPTGDLVVTGNYSKVLAFELTTTAVGGQPGGPALFVLRLPAAYEVEPLRWLHLAKPTAIGFSTGESIGLDPQHVIVAARFRDAAMELQMEPFPPNPALDQFSGVLLPLFP